jgi:hypothetical protein
VSHPPGITLVSLEKVGDVVEFTAKNVVQGDLTPEFAHEEIHSAWACSSCTINKQGSAQLVVFIILSSIIFHHV